MNGGGGGADTLTGGAGNDRFVISGTTGDSVFISDFGAGETSGTNDDNTDNDFVDLTQWYNASTLADYNLRNGTNFAFANAALANDAQDGNLSFIAQQGGPTVTFSLSGTGAMDTEHTGVTCFTRGTPIEVDGGEVAIEDLSAGDLVMTLDHGLQQVRWIGSRKIDATELAANPKLRPIRIMAGALGRGLPQQDVLVSPQHRVLVRSKIAERMFGQAEVLAAAKQLLLLDGIDVAMDVDEVEYFHILFDSHQIVFACGAPMESFYTGKQALRMMSPEAREELFSILPQLAEMDADSMIPARHLVPGRQARKLSARHRQNDVQLLR
ncbi:Hint domain-containing protein [Paracoccus sp. TK19116]|uniref:Hint domain-containing protein n=1 Tax=Paracoccus albicereus TaxID=2922394 RepID=A0ABT1MN23_9RHOB|nr:Hint domain-containing protein [Paracoccus albicereus]